MNNRPFPSCLLPLCQTESSCETIHMKMMLPTGSFSSKSNSFSYERFCAKTRFETEAQGNTEMAYFLNVYKYIEFNREQAKAKKCLKNLIDSDCTFPSLLQEALDLDLGDYNPFCPNRRDPGATGKDQCDGVSDLDNPFNAAAGLKPSVVQALLFSFVALLLVVKI